MKYPFLRGFFRVILLLLGTVATVILFTLLIEFYNLAILGQTEGYPWQCKCFSGMHNYTSPHAYIMTEAVEMLVIVVILYLIYRGFKALDRSSKEVGK